MGVWLRKICWVKMWNMTVFHFFGRLNTVFLLGTIAFILWQGVDNSRYAGNAMQFDEVILKGEPSERKFAAFYCSEGKVLACATLGADPVASAVRPFSLI